MRRTAIPLLLLALLAGCSSDSGPKTAAPPPVAATALEPAPPEPPRRSANDQCGAHEMAYLVGRSKSDIPVPVDPARRRVACTTCPVTMDYSPARLNIFFDAETGVIKEVKCG